MEGTIMKQLQSIVRQFPDKTAQKSKDPGGHYQATDFQTLYRETQEAAAAFLSIGVKRGETVGMIMDNRKETSAKTGAYTILNFKEFMERGGKALSEAPMIIEEEIEKGRPEDAATIIFTSGTTGIPKGCLNFF